MRINFLKCQVVREKGVNYPEVDGKATPSAVHKIATDVLELDKASEEHIYALLLNPKLNINGIVEVSKGTANEATFHAREVFKAAIIHNATSVIIVHNHPSGELSVSNADKETTKQIMAAGKLLNIPLVDHIIVSNEGYLSLKEEQIVFEGV